MAADGQISLCTTIPVGWEIYSIDITALPSCQYKKTSPSIFINIENSYIGSFEKADPSIELLKLSIEDCRNIQKLNHTQQGAFLAGLKTAHNHPPLRTTPAKKKSHKQRYNYSDHLPPSLTRCFAVCKKSSREELIDWSAGRFPYQEFEITKDTIRIAHGHLEKILGNTSNCQFPEPTEASLPNILASKETQKKQYPKSISNRLYTPGRARTKLLEALYRAARKCWEIRLTTGEYPCNKSIVNSIKEICPQCSSSLAKQMASMISPFASDIENGGSFFLTNYFWTLIDAYEKYYCPTNGKKDEKFKILDCLADRGMCSMVTAGHQIIDPEFEANKELAI